MAEPKHQDVGEPAEEEAGAATTEAPAGANGAAPEGGAAAEDGAAAAEPDGAAEAEALRAELGEMRDRFMRALAEAENVRKRADRDRREAEAYGGARIARDLLPVHDSLRRALESVTDEQREASGALIEGVELTLRELLNVFGRHGVTPVEPAVGDAFDPESHEAMFEAPVPGTSRGQIIQVSAVGFRLHDRLLRPAQVGVSSFAGS